MAKIRENSSAGITILPRTTVPAPTSGVLGAFIQETENMLKARGMRMNGLIRRINESGQRAETLLRSAAERMEAAEAAIAEQLANEGLLGEDND